MFSMVRYHTSHGLNLTVIINVLHGKVSCLNLTVTIDVLHGKVSYLNLAVITDDLNSKVSHINLTLITGILFYICSLKIITSSQKHN